MQDIKNLDARGIPGCLIATTEFVDAAAAQTRSLAFDAAIVWVEHPIQNRTAAELETIADAAIEPILEALTGGS